MLAREPEAVRHIVGRSCRLKADVVERDERETTGLRAVLNYGHTFAHAFETVGGYGTWLHGEAVSAGMVCASRLAERRGLIDRTITDRQRRLLEAFGLPTAPPSLPADELIGVMHNDKKASAGRLRFVLPRRLGEAALIRRHSGGGSEENAGSRGRLNLTPSRAPPNILMPPAGRRGPVV